MPKPPPFARSAAQPLLLLIALLLAISSTAQPPSQLLTATVSSTHQSTALHITSISPSAFKNIRVDWSLQTNGTITKKGTTSIPLITPNHYTLVPIPLRLPDDTAGESFLNLRFFSTALIAEQQIMIHPYHPSLSITPGTPLQLSDSNDIATIQSPNARISFNRQTGWLTHYEVKGINLLNDTLQTFAPEPRLQLFSNTTSSTEIIIRTEYTIPATASLLHLSYTINANGEMLITEQAEPDSTQPTPTQSSPTTQPPTPTQSSPATQPPPADHYMPAYAMQWTLPPDFDSIITYGPITNPNIPTPSHRIALEHHRLPNIDTPTAPASTTPPTPSTHSNLRWFTITGENGNGIQFIADSSLLTENTLRSAGRIQLTIDHPTPNTHISQGTYPLVYKVKPLISSPHP